MGDERSSNCCVKDRVPICFPILSPTAIVAASIRAIDLLSESTELRDRLEANTKLFRAGMEKAGFDLIPGQHPIVPIMLGDAALATRMADLMLEKGVYVIGFFVSCRAKRESSNSHANLRGSFTQTTSSSQLRSSPRPNVNLVCEVTRVPEASECKNERY